MTLLTERVTPIVYHVTQSDFAYKILTEQRFNLSNTYGKTEELKAIKHTNKNVKYFYMSVARSPTSAYIIKGRLDGVLFELNGEWFNNNHSSIPFNYWYNEGDKLEQKGIEYEDRILSTRPYIDFSGEATTVIRSLHILLEEAVVKGLLEVESNNTIKSIAMDMNYRTYDYLRTYMLALRLGIPVFMYTKKLDWVNRNKAKALTPDIILRISKASTELKNKTLKSDSKLNPMKASWLVPFGTKIDNDGIEKILDPKRNKDNQKSFKAAADPTYAWKQLYHEKDLGKLSREALEILRKAFTTGNISRKILNLNDLKTMLNGALMGNGPDSKMKSAELFKILSRLGMHKTNDHKKNYIDWIKNKWQDAYTAYIEKDSLIESYLEEKVTDVVYHYTNFANAANILKTKSFLLTSATAHKDETRALSGSQKFSPYYMSVARSSHSRYFNKSRKGVLFVLNGRWLNNRYSGAAFNYFPNGGISDDEMEDRIFSRESVIKFPSDPSNLITEIHILLRTPDEIEKTNMDVGGNIDYSKYYIAVDMKSVARGLEAYRYAKELNIPCWLYTKTSDWVNRNTFNSVSSTQIKEMISALKQKYDPYRAKYGVTAYSTIAKQSVPFGHAPYLDNMRSIVTKFRKTVKSNKDFRRKMYSPGRDPLIVWREFYHVPVEKGETQLSKEAMNVLSYIKSNNGYDILEQALTFERNSADPKRRENLKKMYDIWHKLGIKSVQNGTQQYLNWVLNKWRNWKNPISNIGVSGLFEEKTPNIIDAFHGSNIRFKEFSVKAKRVPNDFFGGGVAYFTDDKKVALTYSRAMTYRYGGEEHLYAVQLNMRNVFDVDKIFSGEELKAFFKYIKVEEFARGAGLLKAGGEEKYTVLAKLSGGHMELSGKDIFRGLSSGMVNSSKAEDILKKMGFDGLRYNGGDNMGAGKHNVYLPYYISGIKIVNVFKVNRKLIKEEAQIPPIGHMSFPRDMLPQIKNQNEFLAHILNFFDVQLERTNPMNLKATQLDGFDVDKIKSIMKERKLDPVIASSVDNQILDGHHRWAAAWNNNKDIDVYFVDAPILELIRVAASFYKTKNEQEWMSEGFDILNEGLNHQVLYHFMNSVKLKNCLGSNKLEARWDHVIPDISYPGNSSSVSDFPEDKKRKVIGTSLTRNKNLDFAGYSYVFELDRKKIRDTNKLHVIDADVTFSKINPHQSRLDHRTRNLYKQTPESSTQFAEEYLEGDLYPLHKYLRSIMLKFPLTKDGIENDYAGWIIKYLANYSIRYNIPIKQLQTEKDITEDIIEKAMKHNDEPIDSRVPYDLGRVIVNMRKSINKAA